MKKVTTLSSVIAVILLAVAVIAETQQPKKVPRVGFLIASSAAEQQPRLQAFKQALRERGYVEGQNISIEVRSGEGTPDFLHQAAAELVRLKVDVIVTGGTASTDAAKKATATIPIIMTQDTDPVGMGFIGSLAHPGGNITGLSNSGGDLGGKRLELLKEIIPKLSRVAVFVGEAQKQNVVQMKEIETSAEALGLRLQILELRTGKDIEPAFQSASKERAGAVLAGAAAVLLTQRKQVAEFAVKRRLPVITADKNLSRQAVFWFTRRA